MKPMTKAQRAALLSDYASGVKMASIGAKWKMAPSNVRTIAKAAGLPPRRVGLHKDPSPNHEAEK